MDLRRNIPESSPFQSIGLYDMLINGTVVKVGPAIISHSLIGDKDVEEETIILPIDGVLDLHNFLPHEVGDLVPAYLAACRTKGICEVRIIHGKGKGNLRRTVHTILS